MAGVVGAVVAGCIMAWFHAWASIRFQANQVVSGMAINLLALGLTSYLFYTLYGSQGTPGNLAGIPNANIPLLGGIKFMSLGSIVFQQNIITYLAAYLDECGKNAGKPLAGPALERFLPWNANPEDLAAWTQPPPPG